MHTRGTPNNEKVKKTTRRSSLFRGFLLQRKKTKKAKERKAKKSSPKTAQSTEIQKVVKAAPSARPGLRPGRLKTRGAV